MGPLNFHHLRYFRAVARLGGLRPAAESLQVSPASISTQVRALEAALGEPLFRRKGRANVLTEAGRTVLRYAEDIFNLGDEMASALRRPTEPASARLHAGVTDTLPKLVTLKFLRPLLSPAAGVRVVCREGKVADLLALLVAGRLDVVLSDEAAPPDLSRRIFSHPLGRSEVAFCAAPKLAARLRSGFPGSLATAPALLPTADSGPRAELDRWFTEHGVNVSIRAEFDDAALAKVAAAEGHGFIAVPAVVAAEACARYGLAEAGRATGCRVRFFALTAERRPAGPVQQLLTAANLPAARNRPTSSPR
ncbi:MAG: LysR family transcriptional regulator [Opitutaceae bacterium]